MPQNQVVSMPWCLVLYLRELWGLEGTQFTLLLAAGILLCVVAAYLLGSINTGIILSKIFFRDDIRMHGSGNAGATNMLRTYGKKFAIATLVGDMIKAAIAVGIGYLIYQWDGAAIAGFFCVFGHMFPIYYRFKGGKGVACSVMVIALMDPITFAILFVCYMSIIFMTRYVSLASIMCILLYPMILHAFRPDQGIMFLCALLMAIFDVFIPRENNMRLYHGNESKLSFKKKAEVEQPLSDGEKKESDDEQ